MRRQETNSALESTVQYSTAVGIQFVFLNIGVNMKAKSCFELYLQIICCTFKLQGEHRNKFVIKLIIVPFFHLFLFLVFLHLLYFLLFPRHLLLLLQQLLPLHHLQTLHGPKLSPRTHHQLIQDPIMLLSQAISHMGTVPVLFLVMVKKALPSLILYYLVMVRYSDIIQLKN